MYKAVIRLPSFYKHKSSSLHTHTRTEDIASGIYLSPLCSIPPPQPPLLSFTTLFHPLQQYSAYTYQNRRHIQWYIFLHFVLVPTAVYCIFRHKLQAVLYISICFNKTTSVMHNNWKKALKLLYLLAPPTSQPHFVSVLNFVSRVLTH